MTPEQLDKLNSFLHSRYTHWSSSMRLEMVERIRLAEKIIEDIYFKQMHPPALPMEESNDQTN